MISNNKKTWIKPTVLVLGLKKTKGGETTANAEGAYFTPGS